MKNAAKAKSAQQKFVCPGCGKTFQNRSGLGSHVAYFGHQVSAAEAKPAKPESVPSARESSKQQPAHSPVPARTPLPVPASSSAPSGAYEHLRAAREVLVQRGEAIEHELRRLTELQAERERVQRELDAVNGALQVFTDNVTTAAVA